MDTYSLLRQIADSWVLLAMFIFFLGVIVWAFRPGSRAVHDDIANIPFRNETIAKQGDENSNKINDYGQGGAS